MEVTNKIDVTGWNVRSCIFSLQGSDDSSQARQWLTAGSVGSAAACCAVPCSQGKTVVDLEKGVMRCLQWPWPCVLPSQWARWSVSGAVAMSSRGGKKKSTKTSRSAKAGVIFPVGRMLRYIKKGHPKYRIGVGAPVYMAAVLEYLTGECSWDGGGRHYGLGVVGLWAFQGLRGSLPT